jgi:hypothetical protein
MEATAEFWMLIIAPWKNPKKTPKTYNPGIVIPNHVNMVILFMKAKGTTTLNLRLAQNISMDTAQFCPLQNLGEFFPSLTIY